MPPLDISWNPYEMLKYEKCFNTLKSLLDYYEYYCLQNLKRTSFSYIQISIASTIVNTRLFFDDTLEFGPIKIHPIPNEDDDFINEKFNIKNRNNIKNYFTKLNFELNILKQKIDTYEISNKSEEIEESVILILQEVTTTFKKINLESHPHPMDLIFETKVDGFDNVFDKLFFEKHAPVSVFKKTMQISTFDKSTKELFDVKLPIPFTGEVQITSLQYSNTGNFESLKFEDGIETIKIENANSISEILAKSLKNEDDSYWVDNFKYLGDGRLLFLINEHENDFLGNYEVFFNSLILDGYSIESYKNYEIEFHKDQFNFRLDTLCIEPLIIGIYYYHEEYDYPLIENKVRAEVLKFLPSLSKHNPIPAIFNKDNFSLIAKFESWGWIDQDYKVGGPYDRDYLTARALKFLSSQRKSLQFELEKNDNPFDRLVAEVNKAENYIYGESFYIDSEYKDQEYRNLIKTPLGFRGFKFQQIEIFTKQWGDNLGDIILWKHKMTKSSVSIEYSIKKTTKELIMNIPFETTKLK